MLPRRPLAGFGLALALSSPAALAQPAPAAPPAAPAPAPAAPAESSVRFTFDLHGGLMYRVGPLNPEPTNRGGGLLGLDALIGSNKWWAIGAGYDHGFIGGEKSDSARSAAFYETNRSLDELWLLGRFYPWQNDDVGVYLQLGLGPTWQQVNLSSNTTTNGASPMFNQTSCSARSLGLGLRGGAGVDVALGNIIIFYGEVGVDHMRLSGGDLDGCAPGLGATTFLATRFGFALATGRQKPPPPPAPPPPPSDRDGDAILDNVDACPDQPGLPNTDPTKNGCPPPSDRDHDGIPDASDACPDQPGPPSDDPKRNGCPDRDGDKIIDSLDACPDVPGVPSDDPKKNGCPADRDGDGIPDDKDACPDEKGLPNEDPAKNGCPLVVVREKEIVIGEQVQFELDKFNIKPASDGLLDTIAGVMKAHPEIARVEVQGHTDNQGKAQHNKELSRERAAAVKRALVKRGVEERRLVAAGYGSEKPIADNATEAGQAKNRRVQFVILEKKAPATPPPPPPPPPPGKKK